MPKKKRVEYDLMEMTPSEILSLLDDIDAENTGPRPDDWNSEQIAFRRNLVLCYIFKNRIWDREAFARCHEIILSKEYGELDEADERLKQLEGRVESIWDNEV